MKNLLLLLFTCTLHSIAPAQTLSDKIKQASEDLTALEKQRQQIFDKIEILKLERIQEDLDAIGLPAVLAGEQLVRHAAMALDYAEKYEQARWVAHIITQDVTKGTVFRTNDFRPDEKVITGSAVEEDYFLKKMKPDSTWAYDAFGYDRGHLAPSADFRWSKTALSESYFYSNMSPQLAAFNRGKWEELEDAIRGYIYRNTNTQLYLVTGPLLKEDLPKIQRGKNKVSIPALYWKAVLDITNKRAIGFIMPNENITKPLSSFAVSINDIEILTGLDLFNKIPKDLQESLESQRNAAEWLPATSAQDAEPIAQETLPRNHFNTTVAKEWAGRTENINVCGKVVSARLSKSGNVLLNLDKPFPNQVFTVFVKKEFILNFNYDLTEVLKNKTICVKGKVKNMDGLPMMYIQTQTDITVQD
jgi:endonuclease G, mitochondrial